MPETAFQKDEAKARRYTRAKRIVRLADFTVELAVLLLLLFSGWSQEWRNAAFELTANPVLALTFYLLGVAALFRVVTFPLDWHGGFTLEHRFGLSTQTATGWLKDWLKGFLLMFLFGLAGAQLVYFSLRRFPATWWIVCSLAFILFFVLLANLAPVLLFPLYFKFEPLENEELKNRLLHLTERLGTRVRGVWLWRLSEKSRKANAVLAGWGNTRRILLSDTLVDGHAPEEIEVILAHELGHHVAGDIWRGILLQSALTFAGFYVVDRALRAWSVPLGFEGPADFANLPLLLLVSTVASLIVMPWANVHSRRRERAADEFALRVTDYNDAFISAMEKLAAQNLTQQQPHPLLEFLFHSHPSVAKRIAFARSQKP